ncbi:MAG: PQQ-dependent sugar dehydrogenase [Actinobacteria bacterium]|nr:PQQ-dependent sugar dehydrogenase [Actinomycetota bacterium]
MSRLAAGLAAFAVLLAGCTGSTPSVTDRSPASTATSSSGRQVLASGLDVPWDVAVLPDHSVLVTLRDRAELVRVMDGTTSVVATVDGVVPAGEGGLLGMALSPGFASDQLLYLYYTAAQDNRVVRYRYTSTGLSDPHVVLAGIPKASNHNGGRIRFGPDGNLYIGTGDAGRRELAQDTSALGGKILRVAPDGSIPSGNPFGNAVWSYGHRNVQGLAWDDAGSLYASEFGQDRFDELNLITAGGNYGWPGSEGLTTDPALVSPLLVWAPSQASPSGIAIRRGGSIYIAALRGERVWRTTNDIESMAEPDVFLDGLGRIRDVEVVGDQLYVLTNNTARGTPRPGDDQLIAVPLS